MLWEKSVSQLAKDLCLSIAMLWRKSAFGYLMEDVLQQSDGALSLMTAPLITVAQVRYLRLPQSP